MNIEEKLYTEISLMELKALLASFPKQGITKQLIKEFKKYSNYKNLEEWNKVVRVCEAFAILGWSKMTPVEAHKSSYFNGSPYTGFYDKDGEEHYQGAIWSKRKNGYTLEPDRVFRFLSKGTTKTIEKVKEDIVDSAFQSQRNWIAKNPVRPFIFLRNAFHELEYIQKKIDDLRDFLDTELNSFNYGDQLNYLSVSVNISSPFTEYEIVNEKTKKSYDFGKIKTPKFRFNRFTKKNGIYTIDYYIPQQFGKEHKRTQIKKLKEDFIFIVNTASDKLKNKCKGYQFEALKDDVVGVLKKWR